ncbi:MAG TPA: choice-of-anchor tandem repeat GloVer-containing protein [Candidatus Obscuribacterales bacterium]
MKKFIALLAALLTFCSAAYAQQYNVLPTGTQVNVIPIDATSGLPANIGSRVTTTAFQPTGYTAAPSQPDASMVVGSDGRIYLPVYSGTVYAIAAMSTGGQFSVYTLPTNNAVGQLTLGSDGNVYGTYAGLNKIFQLTTAGVFTEFTLNVGTTCYGIISNSADSNLYVASATGVVMQVNTSGSVLATVNMTGTYNNGQLALDSQGQVWGGESGKLFTVTTAPAITEYSITGTPTAICADPTTTTVWAMDAAAGTIFNVDAQTGTVLSSVPFVTTPATGVTNWGNLTVFGGNLYATEGSINQLVSINTSTLDQTQYALPQIKNLTGMLVGSDGLLYACSASTGFLYRLEFSGALQVVTADVVSGAVPMQAAAVTNSNGAILKVGGTPTAIVSITGSFTATVNFEASFDNSNWVAIAGAKVGTGGISTTAAGAGDWVIPIQGYQFLRARISGRTAGSVTVNGYTSTSLSVPLPGSTNVIGSVTQSGTWNVGLSAGSNVIGAVTQSGTWNIGSISTLPSIPTGSNVIGGVTQSGTWNIGSITTLPALATGSNVIGGVTQSGTWNIGSITTLPSIPTGSNTIGAVTQSGTWTVQPGNTANTTPWVVNDTTANLSQASTTSGQKGNLIMGAASTTNPTLTNGLTYPISLTQNGAIRVDASLTSSTLPVSLSGTNNFQLLGIAKGTTSALNATVTSLDANHNGLDVNVANGATVNVLGGNNTAPLFVNPTINAFNTPSQSTYIATAQSICAGNDGNIWGLEPGANKVFKMTTSGNFTEYTIPTANSQPTCLIQGSDGNMYGTESATTANKVFKLTTTGTFTEFAVTTASAKPFAICQGTDGNIYGVESNTNKVFKMTTSGTFTEFSTGVTSFVPADICQGADGLLYVAGNGGTNQMFSMTTGGTFTQLGAGGSNYVCHGADNCIYFSGGSQAGVIYRYDGHAVTSFDSTAFSLTPTKMAVASDGNFYGGVSAGGIGRGGVGGQLIQVTPEGVTSLFPSTSFDGAIVSTCEGTDGFLYALSEDTVGSVYKVFQIKQAQAFVNLAQGGRVLSQTNAVPVKLAAQDKSTYVATTTATWAVASAGTDVVVLQGALFRTVKVLRIRVWGNQSTAAATAFSIVKRTTANSGGTSTSVLPLSMDDANPAANSVFTQYTVNPTTLGTAAASISARVVTSNTLPTGPYAIYEAPVGGQPITLRSPAAGTAEYLAINCNGNPPTNLVVEITWTEE